MGNVDILLYSDSKRGFRIKHQKIDKTTYIVRSHFNQRAKINVLQKLDRLMSKDAEKNSKLSGVLNQSVV